MSIPKFSIDDSSDNIVEALSEAGCVVVTGVTDADLRESIRSEMAPYMADAHIQTKDNPDAFYSGFTRRVSALAARSPSITDNLIIHPLSQKICKSHLLSNGEHGWQLHASAVLEVGPGARDQMLHREEDPFTFFPVPRPNIIVASMWAVTDFTVANGATLLVPGSHKWPADRQPEPHEIFNAEMPAGSVLFWALARRRRKHHQRLALRHHLNLFVRLGKARRESVPKLIAGKAFGTFAPTATHSGI